MVLKIVMVTFENTIRTGHLLQTILYLLILSGKQEHAKASICVASVGMSSREMRNFLPWSAAHTHPLKAILEFARFQ